MTVTMLCSAELRSGLCEAETVERAKRALQAGASARTGLRTVCQPATVAEVCDVGSLQPSRGALEAACRWLRTTAMFRPKISEVLAAVREAGLMYETALRPLDELPGQIARAEHPLPQCRDCAQ